MSKLQIHTFINTDLHSCSIRSGALVDAMFLNGRRLGGPGGEASSELVFDPPAHIVQFSYRKGAVIDWLRITFSDGQWVEGGGDGGDLPAHLRVAPGAKLEIRQVLYDPPGWSAQVVGSVGIAADSPVAAPAAAPLSPSMQAAAGSDPSSASLSSTSVVVAPHEWEESPMERKPDMQPLGYLKGFHGKYLRCLTDGRVDLHSWPALWRCVWTELGRTLRLESEEGDKVLLVEPGAGLRARGGVGQQALEAEWRVRRLDATGRRLALRTDRHLYLHSNADNSVSLVPGPPGPPQEWLLELPLPDLPSNVPPAAQCSLPYGTAGSAFLARVRSVSDSQFWHCFPDSVVGLADAPQAGWEIVFLFSEQVAFRFKGRYMVEERGGKLVVSKETRLMQEAIFNMLPLDGARTRCLLRTLLNRFVCALHDATIKAKENQLEEAEVDEHWAIWRVTAQEENGAAAGTASA